MSSLLVLIAVNAATWAAIAGVAWRQPAAAGGLERGEVADNG